MMIQARRRFLLSLALPVAAAVAWTPAARAASAQQIAASARSALQQLYAAQPKTRALARHAKGILVFPRIVKAGFMIGGQTGNGALMVNGRVVGYYNISAASYGLQAGVQTFSYALFFMTGPSLKYLEKSQGWSVGSGPSVVVVDKGAAASMTSTTLSQDVYAFPFGQTGLMAGIGIEGSKITRIHPDR